MATDHKALRVELDLLRSLARRRRAESLKLAQRRMMVARRQVTASAIASPSPAMVAETVPVAHRDAA